MSREEDLLLKFHKVFEGMKMYQIDAQETSQEEIYDRSKKIGEAIKRILFKEFGPDKKEGKKQYGRSFRFLSNNEEDKFNQDLKTAVKKLVSEIKAGQADKIFSEEKKV